MTRPGQLDERNTIYRRDTTTDAVNEEIESWTAVGLRWMRWVRLRRAIWIWIIF